MSGLSMVSRLLLVLIAVLVLYPLAATVARILREAGTGSEIIGSGGLDASLLTILLNTFILVVAGGAVALATGALLAWINERTDAALGFVGDILPLAPLMVPPIAGVIGWVVLLDPRAGLLNNAIRWCLGLAGLNVADGPFNPYSWVGLILVTSLYLVPYVYLVVSAALRRLDPALEEASRVNRAGPLRTLRGVTLPAVAPALGAAGLLTVISGVGMFSVPIVIGTGARIDVLSVRIFRLLSTTFPPRTGVAMILAAMMLLVVQALLALQRTLVRSGQHAAIGGRGFRSSPVALGRWKGWARAAGVAYVVATAVLPVAGLLLVSVQHFWTPAVRWDQLTMANYQLVLFQNRDTSHSLVNSLLLGLGGATLTMLVAALLMLQVQVANGAGRRLVDGVTALPATIPHTVIGVSFLVAFSRPPLPLYGTVYILLLAYVAMQLPYAARTASSAASDVGNELAEASRVFGAGEQRTFRKILLPLALPGLAAGWVIVFVHMVGELTASALLSGTSNPVVGRVLVDLFNNGSFPQLTSLAIVMSAIDSVFVLLMLRLTRRSFDLTVS
jgi:iron(III) transport system permease protein